ncbi:C40 family peptidase [Peptacetobacter hiranonis]|uniref:C40 family peptidase n=1 Tax=Peptacetobacter hiranonis TaxID=89152 RepID=UPI0022E06724|nr:NlpC/P60 family protein [Peptacetobacter hiranonis]
MTKIFKNKFLAKIMAAVMISGAIMVTDASVEAGAEELENIQTVSTTDVARAAAKNGFVQENGKTYYYKDGVKQRGWLKLGNDTYFLTNDKSLAKEMWRTIEGKKYYFDAKGVMVKNTFKEIKGKVYRFDNNGVVSNNKCGKVVNCDFLNVRDQASTKGNVREKIYAGKFVEILNTSGSWYKVGTESGKTGWVSSTYVTIPGETSTKAEAALKVAKAQLGKPYKWGATGPSSFDCSGLTYYAYKNGAKVSIPRTSREQSKYGKKVSKSELKPGDLVFFGKGSSVNHVGMYIGNDQYIHSPQTGDVVKISKLSARKMIVARRVV